MGLKGMPPCAQLFTQLDMVVDLPVESCDNVLLGSRHGLCATRKVNDGKPPVAEKDRQFFIDPKSATVRSSVPKSVRHRSQHSEIA
jgi:hypothetical protein